MGKADRRNSLKMLRRRSEAGKKRAQARRVAAATEARKKGTKVKKAKFAPPPPKVEVPAPAPVEVASEPEGAAEV